MEQQTPPSVVQEFYKDQTILLTGITGFIGQCLLERLIRCGNVNKIYTIIRRKKDNSIEERMKRYYDKPIFECLRKKDPNFMNKVIALEGDLTLPALGLSPENRRLLTENVTLIVHNAASVLFLLRISHILKANVLGTKKVLDLASECTHLRAFMYMSTAYSQSHNLYIEERCYAPPGDMKMVEDIIAADTISDEGMSEESRIQCLGYCANNYTFSKAIAEGLVEQFSRKVDFPCGIFRPSIVCAANREPISGWVSNLNGPTIQVLATAAGIMHIVLVPGDPSNDIVPVDFTSNALITSLWNLATVKKPREKCHVYSYTSSKLNPTSFKRLSDTTVAHMREMPTKKVVWYPCVVFPSNETVFYVLHYMFHVLPAVLFDVYRVARGKKPLIIHQLKKMSTNVSGLIKFSTTDFQFEVREWFDIWETMNSTDREIFYSDVRDIDWPSSSHAFFDYLRTEILKETDEDLQKARRKLFKLKILHYVTCAVFLFGLLYFLYSLVCRVLGL